MPTLAPPPLLESQRRSTAAPAPTRLELPSVSFFGRSLAEYAQFFALDLAAWRGRDVLDVAAGPSSFTAEACARKIHAVAVDPLYGYSAGALQTRVKADFERMFAQIRAKPKLVRVEPRSILRPEQPKRAPASTAYFESIDAAEGDRRAAVQRFLGDYETQFAYNRYVAGALPRLPFLDGTFDLVLCAHLLFVFADRFDFDWHVAACRELVRVTAGEVRIHPLCGLDGRAYPALPRLRRELRALGIASDVVAVDYEFFVGANSMLVLRKGSS